MPTLLKVSVGVIILLMLLAGVGVLIWLLSSNNGSKCSQSDPSSCDTNEWCNATGACQRCSCTSSNQQCDFSSGRCLCSSDDQSSCASNQWCNATTCEDCDCVKSASCEFVTGKCSCDKEDSSSCKTGQWCNSDNYCHNCDCENANDCDFGSGGCCDPVTNLTSESGHFADGAMQVPVTWTWPKNNSPDIACTLQMVGQNSGCKDVQMSVECNSEQATYPFHTGSVASDTDYLMTFTTTGGPCTSEGKVVTEDNDGWQVWQHCTAASDCIGYQAGVTTCDAPGCAPGQCQTVCHNVSCET